MKRIGIAASRIAKDDLVLYNVFVIVLSFLLSLLIFFISAFSIVAGMALVSYVSRGLAGVVSMINLTAVLVNIKLKR